MSAKWQKYYNNPFKLSSGNFYRFLKYAFVWRDAYVDSHIGAISGAKNDTHSQQKSLPVGKQITA